MTLFRRRNVAMDETGQKIYRLVLEFTGMTGKEILESVRKLTGNPELPLRVVLTPLKIMGVPLELYMEEEVANGVICRVIISQDERIHLTVFSMYVDLPTARRLLEMEVKYEQSDTENNE